jgi:hypothetical protein
MSAVAVGATAAWRNTTWLLWRQHRAALLGVLGLFGFAATVLVVTGIRMHSSYHTLGLDTCTPIGSRGCGPLVDQFEDHYFGLALYLPRILEFLPALVGAFVGGPLLAREYETGTFRFAWTQGTGRVRWLLSRLAFLGLALVAIAVAFTLLYTWWYRPFEPIEGRLQSGQAFEIEGVVFAARTLFAFCLGAFAGAVTRRTVPAIAATLIGWVAVVAPTVIALRQHYRAPLVAQVADTTIAGTDWSLVQWMEDPSGQRLSSTQIDALARTIFNQGANPQQWFPEHGYTLWHSYQPASRFWPFQLVEAGWVTALALLLAAATVYLVRRP